jgi:hypothetical protein
VRLWPALDGTRGPLVLPIDDPSQLSLARTPTGFMIATLDTIGGAEVYEVRDHDGELRLDTRFSIPPSDPLFELHVLDGGERLLALGVDHRIRLYDAHGTELSSIAEHGFVPWQLRHVETEAGVTLVAILAGPTRVQPLELREDRLRIVGEAIPFDLDRGPNRNDLALTPDGEHIAAFSRRKWRSGDWQLRIVSLADGRERLIEGKSDRKAERPRVHLLDGDRMLLDDGTGIGQLISLDPAQPSAPTTRALPGSDPLSRLFTSVERGVRMVPDGDHFIVDRLDGDEHVRIGREHKPMRSAGFGPDGTRVIWAFSDGWAIESLDGATAGKPTIHEHAVSPLRFAEFVDDHRAVLVAENGQIELVHSETGEVLASVLAPQQPAEARLARGESPLLLVRDLTTKFDHLFDLSSHGVIERGSVPAEPTFIGPSYPKLWTSMSWSRIGWFETTPAIRTFETELVTALESSHFHLGIRDIATIDDEARVFAVRADTELLIRTRSSDAAHVGQLEATYVLGDLGTVTRLAPSPAGNLLALVQTGGHVSVHDTVTLERQWTRVDAGATALGWSADGSRLAIAGEPGGAVLDAATGEIELERRDFGLHVERNENLMPLSDASLQDHRLPNR